MDCGSIAHGQRQLHFTPDRQNSMIVNCENRPLFVRHEVILFLVLALEWLYFNSVGPRFATLDNSFDILRHSVEIGLLAVDFGNSLSGRNVSAYNESGQPLFDNSIY